MCCGILELKHQLGKHNLTLMFNSIETNERFVEDAVEHGNQIPVNEDHKSNNKLTEKKEKKKKKKKKKKTVKKS